MPYCRASVLTIRVYPSIMVLPCTLLGCCAARRFRRVVMFPVAIGEETAFRFRSSRHSQKKPLQIIICDSGRGVRGWQHLSTRASSPGPPGCGLGPRSDIGRYSRPGMNRVTHKRSFVAREPSDMLEVHVNGSWVAANQDLLVQMILDGTVDRSTCTMDFAVPRLGWSVGAFSRAGGL